MMLLDLVLIATEAFLLWETYEKIMLVQAQWPGNERVPLCPPGPPDVPPGIMPLHQPKYPVPTNIAYSIPNRFVEERAGRDSKGAIIPVAGKTLVFGGWSYTPYLWSKITTGSDGHHKMTNTVSYWEIQDTVTQPPPPPVHVSGLDMTFFKYVIYSIPPSTQIPNWPEGYGQPFATFSTI